MDTLSVRLARLSSWSVSFICEWRQWLSPISVIRFRNYMVRRKQGRISNAKRLPLNVIAPWKSRVYLREVGSDVFTFQEIVKGEIYKSVAALVPSCETIIDLGANIGLAALYFTTTYPRSRVFAVEPNPSSHELLELNLQDLIRVGRCKTLQAAVWSHPSSVVSAATSEPDHYSMFAVRAMRDGEETGDSIVGLTMQTIVDRSGFGAIDLLKVDIEGAEVQLFSGDTDWLRRVAAIAIEFHGSSRRDICFDQLMSRYGFRIHDEESHTTIAVKELAGF